MMDKEKYRKLLFLVKEMAAKHTDQDLNQAIDILTQAIDEGCEDPGLLVTTATYLCRVPHDKRSVIEKPRTSCQSMSLSPKVFILKKRLLAMS
jgi:hypothetical protein